jgi:hypothetical protein
MNLTVNSEKSTSEKVFGFIGIIAAVGVGIALFGFLTEHENIRNIGFILFLVSAIGGAFFSLKKDYQNSLEFKDIAAQAELEETDNLESTEWEHKSDNSEGRIEFLINNICVMTDKTDGADYKTSCTWNTKGRILIIRKQDGSLNHMMNKSIGGVIFNVDGNELVINDDLGDYVRFKRA